MKSSSVNYIWCVSTLGAVIFFYYQEVKYLSVPNNWSQLKSGPTALPIHIQILPTGSNFASICVIFSYLFLMLNHARLLSLTYSWSCSWRVGLQGEEPPPITHLRCPPWACVWGCWQRDLAWRYCLPCITILLFCSEFWNMFLLYLYATHYM